MTNILRSVRGAILTSVALLGVVGCNMDVTNPSVIDASTFNPATDGHTLSLSAQTNFYIAFQSVALYGGLISEELWTGQVRQQVDRLSNRTFLSTDDINPDFFAPLSLAVASNENAVAALEKGSNAASDVNLARASMSLGFALELSAETMCSSVIQGGPELSDTQLLDSAITRFTNAITIGTAAGAAGGDIVTQSTIGLARAYLQNGQYAQAETTAAAVPSSYVAYVPTSASLTVEGTLGNQIYGYTVINDGIVPARYRDSSTINDPRLPSANDTIQKTENGTPLYIQTKYTSYGSPIRLVSGLEAQYVAAEATLHASGNTGPALSLIAARRAAGNQSAYSGGTDTLSVLTELLNQSARDFWLEAKKLGDLRRNPSVPLTGVLTDSVGTPFYVPKQAPFGSNFCTPIPPQETSANPHFKS